MKKEWKQLLDVAFYAPEPKAKRAFLINLRPREINTIEMILQQVSYIRTFVWLLVFGIIIIAIAGSFFKIEGTENIITMIMPFSASVAVLETKRSKKYNMSELEMSTRFSLRSVVFARMIALGIAVLLLLIIISPVIAIAFKGKTIATAIHIMIPYLVTMFISLKVERTNLGRKTGYSSMAIAAIVTIIIFIASNSNPGIVMNYISFIEDWGTIIVMILLIITVLEQWKTIKNAEAYV